MKKTVVIYLVIFFLLLSGVLRSQPAENIELSYRGESDKLYTKIIFHLSGPIYDDSIYYIEKIDIDRNQFDSIRKIIERVGFSFSQPDLSGFFAFDVSVGNEEKI